MVWDHVHALLVHVMAHGIGTYLTVLSKHLTLATSLCLVHLLYDKVGSESNLVKRLSLKYQPCLDLLNLNLRKGKCI